MIKLFEDTENEIHPAVWADPKTGALRYEYRLVYSDRGGPCSCAFSLFSEVGEPYQEAFKKFFEGETTYTGKVNGLVDHGNEWPYISDRFEFASLVSRRKMVEDEKQEELEKELEDAFS